MTTPRTDRLTLRSLAPGDAEVYAAMRYHSAVAKWLPPAAGHPLEAAHATIARFTGAWQERGHAPWGLRYRKDVVYKGLAAAWLDIDRARWLGYSSEMCRPSLRSGRQGTNPPESLLSPDEPTDRPPPAPSRPSACRVRRRASR